MRLFLGILIFFGEWQLISKSDLTLGLMEYLSWGWLFFIGFIFISISYLIGKLSYYKLEKELSTIKQKANGYNVGDAVNSFLWGLRFQDMLQHSIVGSTLAKIAQRVVGDVMANTEEGKIRALAITLENEINLRKLYVTFISWSMAFEIVVLKYITLSQASSSFYKF